MKRLWSIIIPIACTLAAVAIGATAKRSVSLTNFNAGELAPLMQSRVDFPKYNSGAKTLQNMIVRAQGPASRRPGTKFIAEVKDGNDYACLIPFEYSTDDAYIIEVGDLYMRFYRDGNQVPISALDANAYEIVSPYDANDLFEIQYAQDAQYMRLVHPDYAPYKLTRTGHAAWTLTAVDYTNGPFLDENDDTDVTITPSAVTGDITLSSTGSSVWDADHVGALWQITHIDEANSVNGGFVLNLPYAGNPPSASLFIQKDRYFDFSTHGSWDGTCKLQRSFDEEVTWEDVIVHTSNFDGNIQYSGQETDDDAYYRVRLDDYTQYTDRSYCVYNLVARSFAIHGVVEITAVADVNDANATVVEELGGITATYRWAEGVWSDYRGWPRTVEHHEQRCLYGGSEGWPQAVWASVTASQDSDYDDFDEGESLADDAWTYILPGMNPIQWMKSAEYLMIGTTGGVGRLGSTETPIDATAPPTYRLQAKTGAAYIDAVDAVDAILYVERGNQKVREVSYTYSSDRYIAPDMTILAEHVGREGIVDIAFADRPDPILWCVRDDGQLLSFTYAPKHEVLAWGRHVTGQDVNDMTSWDEFESVAVIPGSSERANGDDRDDDEVWVIVKRTLDSNDYRFIEQFQPLDWGDDPNYCWFVDCAFAGDTNGTSELEEETPDVNNTLTFINQNGTLYALPIGDVAMLGNLTAAGAATDIGGGVVGLPYVGHPFQSTDTILVEGTTNYDDVTFTVAASTTADVIHISPLLGYTAETFDGTETVVKTYGGMTAGFGRMVLGDSNDLYIGHSYRAADTSFITTISMDDPSPTRSYNDFNTPTAIREKSGATITGLAITDDKAHLYALTGILSGYLTKYSVSTGEAVWNVSVSNPGYNLVVDEDDNAYCSNVLSGAERMQRYEAADGSVSPLTNMGETGNPYINENMGYSSVVDNDLGIVVTAGRMFVLTNKGQDVIGQMYNLAVRTFSDGAGDTILLGENYTSGSVTLTRSIETGRLLVKNGYIYVLMDADDASTLYKLRWNNGAIELLATADGPAYGTGFFFDLYDNLVVVTQDYVTAQTTLLSYYNTSLELQGTLGNFDGDILKLWDSIADGAAIRGGVAFNGSLTGYGSTWTIPSTTDNHMEGVSQCVYADGRPIGEFTVDANGTLDLGVAYDVVIAGLNYFSILETMPIQIPETLSRKASIEKVSVDFLESMGANVGSNMDYSSNWLFSENEFATAIPPYTGYKGPTGHLRGMTKEPTIYLWLWEPIPMTIRSITADMEVTIE